MARTLPNTDTHVLPRPVEALPEYAKVDARNNLKARLVEAFGLTVEAAGAIANAVVDPSGVRKHIGDPKDPTVESLAVPGGTLKAIRTEVWSKRVMPDPRNPRIGPSRRHPIAIDPGTGGEDSRFRPIPEPRSLDDDDSSRPELVVDVENRSHLEWGAAQAAKYILAENDWSESIASQGVMEAVWLVPVHYRAADGTATATSLTSAEGSSRLTAVHRLLGVRSADVPFDENDRALRAELRRLNEAQEYGTLTQEQAVEMRCARVPALVLIGFDPHGDSHGGFPTAVKSIVALRHVDYPKPWGPGPENESLADEVLAELYRREIISGAERDWLAGACTKAEAVEAHLSDDPVIRAARIVDLFTTNDDGTKEAIRVAVTSQSTRKRVTPKLRNELATSLILRTVAEESSRVDRIRRYMKHGFGKAVHRETWSSSDKDVGGLADEALKEVAEYLSDDKATDPGPASVELAVRAAYPLISTGKLTADRGTANNVQPDRRTPGEVLDTMRRSRQGVLQLKQAITDFASGSQRIRLIGEDGEVRSNGDGASVGVNDYILREEYPPRGPKRPKSGGSTPDEELQGRLVDFNDALARLEAAHEELKAVKGADGRSLIDVTGADPHLCRRLSQSLEKIREDLTFWGRTFSRTYATSSTLDDGDLDEQLGSDEDELDETEAAYERSYDQWDGDDSGEEHAEDSEE